MHINYSLHFLQKNFLYFNVINLLLALWLPEITISVNLKIIHSSLFLCYFTNNCPIFSWSWNWLSGSREKLKCEKLIQYCTNNVDDTEAADNKWQANSDQKSSHEQRHRLELIKKLTIYNPYLVKNLKNWHLYMVFHFIFNKAK